MTLASRPTLLDLFCGAGGAGAGYYAVGFDVMGVDLEPQPHYPFPFIQADALDFLAREGHRFTAIHSSPPCPRYSAATKRWPGRAETHPDLVDPTRRLLRKVGRPYVIENVVGAPLKDPVVLCGSMFGLQVRRHRLFETSFEVDQPECRHREAGRVITVAGKPGGKSTRDGLTFGNTKEWSEAMGIDWMTGRELAKAIPPAYTAYIGEFLLRSL